MAINIPTDPVIIYSNLSDWDRIKDRRNYLLASCDWVAVSDSQLSEEKKSQWLIYRQALRDLPQNFNNPEDVIWPVKPL